MISPFQAIPVAKVFCGITTMCTSRLPRLDEAGSVYVALQGEVPTPNTRRSFHGYGRGWDSPRSTFYPTASYRGRN